MLRALAIDFNSYFASVEQQERPELRGKPVGVVPVLAETTGCVAISLEAKALGLERNIRVAEARLRCPGIIIVESRPDLYIRYHRQLKALVETCLPVKKVQSIDELECELSGDFARPARALQIARDIKAKIARDAGPLLRSSIGLGPNWFIAKVASDMQKPDGLVLIDSDDLPQKLLHLELRDLTGIGANMEKRLRAAGIATIAQLYAASRDRLRAIWGSVEGARFYEWMRGAPLEREPSQHNTIGHGHVLPPAGRNDATALAVLHRLLQKAAMRLRHSGHYAGALHLTVRYTDRKDWDAARHCNETQDTLHFTHVLNELWAGRPRELRGRAPLQVGVVLTHLLTGAEHTPDLFEADKETSRARLHSAVDELNKTFGKNSVYFGGAHGATDYAPMRIAFTRIPDPELEEIDAARERRLKPKTPRPPEGK
ncbi:MAG: DNA polymerase [Verrucomicrobia bacterium]|nr:DNA polymerase [Verrucomicrobiota bacterium]